MMAFLYGGTEYAPEGGRAWRSRLRAWLEENLNHHVYDSTLEARRGLRRAGRRGIGLKPPSCHAEPVGHSAANGPEHSEGAQGKLREASLYYLENKFRGPSRSLP